MKRDRLMYASIIVWGVLAIAFLYSTSVQKCSSDVYGAELVGKCGKWVKLWIKADVVYSKGSGESWWTDADTVYGLLRGANDGSVPCSVFVPEECVSDSGTLDIGIKAIYIQGQSYQ